jgi:hypothetical protein
MAEERETWSGESAVLLPQPSEVEHSIIQKKKKKKSGKATSH